MNATLLQTTTHEPPVVFEDGTGEEEVILSYRQWKDSQEADGPPTLHWD